MTYIITYTMEPKRIISGVIMDSRFIIVTPIVGGMNGAQLKAFVDAQIQVAFGLDVLVYKIETDTGNMVGFFSVQVGNMGQSGVKLQQFLRPAFQQFTSTIALLINQFVSTGQFKPDFLI